MRTTGRMARVQIRLSPAEIRVDRQYRFVSDNVRDCARVLEVGCGRGDLARRLGSDGIAVTATGRQMIAAIATRFAIRDTQRGAYLYRYICAGLPDDEAGTNVAAYLVALEEKRCQANTLDPVGLRIVGIRH